MFRIKTDIRQYKCETKDKVEKLIRNWVIRPGDLIYDADDKEWAPIGEHPAFVSLFGVLDEQEKNTPDTVVTRRSPYAGDPESDEDDGDSDDDSGAGANGVSEAEEAVEEVTQLVDRDEVTSDEDEEEEDEEEADEEPQEVTKITARPSVSDSEASVDARETDVFDQEEIADSLAEDSRPKPPEAPDGVEKPANDGEVTMMTERTLEMLKITDEDDAAASDERPEEVTDVRERDDEDVTEEEEEDEADEEAEEQDADEEETEEAERVPLPKPAKKTIESGPKLGRHDLPEELFATNEISSPEVQEQMKRLDELGEIEPSDPTLLDEDTPSQLHEDSGIDEAWNVIAEDLRTTEELDADDDLPDELPDSVAETDELGRDEAGDAGEWDEDTSEPEIVRPTDFVSDGYNVPLPFPVRPTADDIRAGMPQGRVSRAAKDRTFPPPEPKSPGDVHHRRFDLTPKPPRDRTVFVFGAVAVLVLLIAFAVVSC